MNESQVIVALGLTGPLELYSLMRNPGFPQPSGGLWDSGAIMAFASTMAAALAAWPSLSPDNYASANWATLATTTPGQFTPSPGGLMGGASQTGIYGSGGPRTGIYGRGGFFD
jgi:hypothetical protein